MILPEYTKSFQHMASEAIHFPAYTIVHAQRIETNYNIRGCDYLNLLYLLLINGGNFCFKVIYDIAQAYEWIGTYP